jgi:hypothetical protein
MNQLLIFLTVLLFVSCTDRTTNQAAKTSYWQSLADSFAKRNLSAFVVDSQLENSYERLHPFRNKTIDSVVRYGTSYLYSWQDRKSGFTEFTTFVNDGEHGSRIMYFIFDADDSLRSVTQVANKGGEGGILYETRSRFITKDALLKTSAATTVWDLTKPAPPPRLNKPKGDSTFYYLKVLNNGRIVEKQFAERKELNLN